MTEVDMSRALAGLLTALADHDYSTRADGNADLRLESPARGRTLIVRAIASPSGAGRLAVELRDAQGRSIDVEDWLVANGLSGTVRFRALAQEPTAAFVATFADGLRGALTGPLRELVTGQAWREAPRDWRGYRDEGF